MATSAENIKTAILGRLKAKPSWGHMDDPHTEMLEFIEAVSEGVYEELQKLEDASGNPASPAHK